MLHVVTGTRGAYRVRVSKLLGCALSVLLCLPLDTDNMVKILNIKKI